MSGLDSTQNQESGSGLEVKMQHKLAGILINQQKLMAVLSYEEALRNYMMQNARLNMPSSV